MKSSIKKDPVKSSIPRGTISQEIFNIIEKADIEKNQKTPKIPKTVKKTDLKNDPKNPKGFSDDILDENIRCDVSDLPIYDFNKLPENFSMIIASKRRSGKSVLCNYLLHPIRKRFDEAYLLSTTALYQSDIYSMIPKINRFNTFDEGVLENIKESQCKMVEFNQRLEVDKRKYNKVLVVLDDVIQDPKVRKSEILNWYFTAGRHLHISIICISQTISARNGFPSVILTNSDIGISFMLHNQYCRESFCERYMSIENKKKGIILFNSIVCEKPYQAVVCDLSISNLKSYKDYVFKIIADPKIPKYIIGKSKEIKTINKYNTEIYNKDIKRKGFKLC